MSLSLNCVLCEFVGDSVGECGVRIAYDEVAEEGDGGGGGVGHLDDDVGSGVEVEVEVEVM